jgi:hypothetical protein
MNRKMDSQLGTPGSPGLVCGLSKVGGLWVERFGGKGAFEEMCALVPKRGFGGQSGQILRESACFCASVVFEERLRVFWLFLSPKMASRADFKGIGVILCVVFEERLKVFWLFLSPKMAIRAAWWWLR